MNEPDDLLTTAEVALILRAPSLHGALLALPRAGSCVGDDHAADLCPPVADGRGSHPRRRRRSDALGDLAQKFCALFAD